MEKEKFQYFICEVYRKRGEKGGNKNLQLVL